MKIEKRKIFYDWLKELRGLQNLFSKVGENINLEEKKLYVVYVFKNNVILMINIILKYFLS